MENKIKEFATEQDRKIYKIKAFYTGEGFHRVAQDIIPDDFLFNDDDDEHWFVPSIVNLAFACEVYIKSLISLEMDIIPQGHSWNKLLSKREGLIEAIKQSSRFKGDDEIEEKISMGEKVFTEWRYAFEDNKPRSVNLVFLERFALVLHDLAKEEIEKLEV